MRNINNKPIGIFDSGVGGLSNVKGIIETLPNENIVFFGDNARVPYGNKSADIIKKFTEQIVSFLLSKNVKALVIACNTISAVAKDIVLNLALNIPVIDVITAGATYATTITKNNKIGVIATRTTTNSQVYKHAIHSIDKNIQVYSQACPLFVPFVEEGLINHKALELIAQDYLKTINESNVDTLILGCTHYPLIKDLIGKICNNMKIVDSVNTTANTLKQILLEKNLLNLDCNTTSSHSYYVTDDPKRFKDIGENFLNMPMEQIKQVNID